MKKPLIVIAALLLFLSTSFSPGCYTPSILQDDFINKQVDSLKGLYSKEGYELLKEASISMESEFEMPVIVPLTQGAWYQFVLSGIILRVYTK